MRYGSSRPFNQEHEAEVDSGESVEGRSLPRGYELISCFAFEGLLDGEDSSLDGTFQLAEDCFDASESFALARFGLSAGSGDVLSKDDGDELGDGPG